MRVMVINRAGDAGKTTFSKHCAKPRMHTPVCFAIEHAQQGNTALRAYADHKIGAEDFPMVAESLIQSQIDDFDVLVDMGTSDRVAAAASMDSMHEILAFFDVFAVPCKPNEKQVQDTLATIDDLVSRGVPTEKIIVVRNSVRPLKADLAVYAPLESASADLGFKVSAASIPQQDIVGSLVSHVESIPEMASLDLKAAAPEKSATQANKQEYAKMVVMSMQAKTMNKALDAVWSEVAAVAA